MGHCSHFEQLIFDEIQVHSTQSTHRKFRFMAGVENARTLNMLIVSILFLIKELLL